MINIINKIKELYLESNDKCDNKCSNCALDKLVFDTYGEGNINICDCLKEVYYMNFETKS